MTVRCCAQTSYNERTLLETERPVYRDWKGDAGQDPMMSDVEYRTRLESEPQEPAPAEMKNGSTTGYHCWSQFYLPAAGWVPIDASEAYKHPERREHFFGSQGADRIRFTTGRDLQLGPAQHSGPLNYFVYPHVEQGDAAWKGPIAKTFSYRDVETSAAVRSVDVAERLETAPGLLVD